MTFQYFIGTILFALALDFLVIVVLDGIFGLFHRPIGDRYLKVVLKNDGVNY